VVGAGAIDGTVGSHIMEKNMMEKSFYYTSIGTVYGIGLAELSYSFGWLHSDPSPIPGIFTGIVFIVVSLVLYYYSERIMEKLGVKE